MPSIAEVLEQSGFSKEAIAALDAKALTALGSTWNTVETTAAQAAAKAEADRKSAEASVAAAKIAQDAAELNKRTVDEFWANTYSPNIASWEEKLKAAETKAANEAALAAFYKTQNEGARASGFVPVDAPVFTPSAVTPPNPAAGTRDPQGRFVPGPNGSPVFDPNTVISRVGDGMNMIQNIMWKYQTLYGGQPLPIPPTELIAKADQLKLNPMEYAARTFRFAEKEQEQRDAAAKAHDDAIRAARDTEKDAEWKAKLDARESEYAAKEKLHAERAASGSPVSVAVSSRIPELQRKVVAKEMPDPLMMNENQRRANTAKMIRDQIAESKSQAVA